MTKRQHADSLIFKVEKMEEVLLSSDIALRKMSLGKLSHNQLKMAYGVLTELQTLITSDSINKTSIIVDFIHLFHMISVDVNHQYSIMSI